MLRAESKTGASHPDNLAEPVTLGQKAKALCALEKRSKTTYMMNLRCEHMAKKFRSPKTAKRHSVQKVLGRETRDGRHVWRVSSGSGQIGVMVTSATSVDTLAKGKDLYKRALRRLADR